MVIQWKTDQTQPHAQGVFGFSAHDAVGNLLYQRVPSYAGSCESDRIDLLSVAESITFETDSTDGFLGWIDVTIDGETQIYHCIDCLSDSPSTTLGRLNLDENMDGPHDLPKTANCQNSCTFIKGETCLFICMSFPINRFRCR